VTESTSKLHQSIQTQGHAQGTPAQQIAKMTEQSANKLRKRELKVIPAARGDRSAQSLLRNKARKALDRAKSWKTTQVVGFQCNSIHERFRNDIAHREGKIAEGYDSDDIRAIDLLALSEGHSMAQFALSRD